MATPRNTAPAPLADPTGGLNLATAIHVRISAEAEDLIKKLAQKTGLKPSTWARVALYKVLGIIKD
jgi:hypothetical protein